MNVSNSLHIACMFNDTTRVQHLLHAGAHRNAENTSGTTALELADFLHRVEIVKLLLHDVDIKENGSYELLRAIRIHRVTVVRALLEMGVREDLGRDEAFFRGVLTMACCVGNAAVLEVLVKYGPEVEMVPLRDVLTQCALAAGNMEVADGIGLIVGAEREIQGSSMDSASDASAAPSVADSAAMDPYLYGSAHGWGSGMPMESGGLWQVLRGL